MTAPVRLSRISAILISVVKVPEKSNFQKMYTRQKSRFFYRTLVEVCIIQDIALHEEAVKKQRRIIIRNFNFSPTFA